MISMRRRRRRRLEKSNLTTWRKSAELSFNRLLSGKCKSDILFEQFDQRYTDMFTDMSRKGIILENVQLGEISKKEIKRTYISFSVPLEIIQSITNTLKDLEVIYIVSSLNKGNKLNFDSYGAEILSFANPETKEQEIVTYRGENTMWTDLNSIPENIEISAKIIRSTFLSADVNFRTIDEIHYESTNSLDLTIPGKSIVVNCLGDKLDNKSIKIIEDNIATITVIDIKWPSDELYENMYVFDKIEEIMEKLQYNIGYFNIAQEEKKDIKWYSECSSERDPILLEDFSDLEEEDVTRIFLGDNKKGECYVTDQLLRFWDNPEIIMRNWIRAIPNIPIGKSGFEGKPGNNKYYQLPLSGSWITEPVVEQIRQNSRILRLKVKKRDILIGNRHRSYGASEIHGQSPGVVIWRGTFNQKAEIKYRSETISAGGFHSVAIRNDGTLVSWGDDLDKQISNTPNGYNFVQVSAGDFHSVALRADGTIISWGSNSDNQISNTPDGSDFVQVSAGGKYSIALRKNGTITAWGDNNKHRIPDNSKDSDFTQISANKNHSIALRENGTVTGWGYNTFGEKFEPTNSRDFIQISAGNFHSVSLRKSGTLVSWGNNLGKQISDTPDDSDIIQVSAGDRNSVALRENGTLIIWGSNNVDQLSDVPDNSGFIQVSAGNVHFVALRKDGSVVSWGHNGYNQVSDTPTESDFRV